MQKRPYDSWDMVPLNGSTGRAFMGIKQSEKVFFKKNSSPFIATLSAYGLAPKLKWTQRTFSGEVLTAQEWLEGDLLERSDMSSPEVIELIRSVHESYDLKEKMLQLKENYYYPLDLLEEYFIGLPDDLYDHYLLNEIVTWLEESIDDDFYHTEFCVCHGDLNHNNFIRTKNGDLYLVDWDKIKLADPLLDVTFVLMEYFKPSQWNNWLQEYKMNVTPQVYKRIRWYALYNGLILIKQYYTEQQQDKVNELILLCRNIYTKP